MTDDRHIIARKLSHAARALSPDARRSFRAFLSTLPGYAPPKPKKAHSWTRPAKPSKKPVAKRQGEFSFIGNQPPSRIFQTTRKASKGTPL